MSQRDQRAEATFDTLYQHDKGSEKIFDINFQERKGTVRLFTAEDFTIIDTTFRSAPGSALWSHQNEQSFVELNFVMAGHLYQSHSGLLEEQLYTTGYHNCLFNPDSFEKNELVSDKEFQIVSVQLQPGEMVRLLLDYAPELEAFAHKIDKRMRFACQAPVLALPGPIKYMLKTLWQSPDNAGLKRLHFESVFLQLLSHQYNQMLHCGQPAVSKALKISERDKLYQARALLLQQLNDPPQLAALAKQCELNEFSLKKGFKQLFGTTVFGFVLQQRMEAARSAINSGEKTITEIAYEMGFAHPQHFHRVFKKYYGVTPKTLKT